MVTTRAKSKSRGQEQKVGAAVEGETGTKGPATNDVEEKEEGTSLKPSESKAKQRKKAQAVRGGHTAEGARDDDDDDDDDDDNGGKGHKKKSTPKSKKDQKEKEEEEKGQGHAGNIRGEKKNGTPETILALLLNAILSSTRVSHNIAAKTTALVIKARYHKLDVLKKSTWEERTEVLTKGGYTHYREKTATFMGQLAELVEEKYAQDGDLNRIPRLTSGDRRKIRAELQKIKGIGDVGIDIFFTTAQHLWPCLTPWIDLRSRKTAEHIGLGNDVQTLCDEVGHKPELMCRLACALMDIRLEKEAEWA
ncbi:uncharacterized protein Z519_07073 [Cladophialophora bantiana CBS 173.52]|uniref:HhH-GPD domain-containing protein n=1 Tax=Cladophialophora bantiana (strain ATCC 10958 / CBS 173.52 / CDC B-1940 / NIH 8579) TaxID=1442370 RepID=A0A0D2I5C6_CLAB1|nr:uncharacterized protein Z519_07073 [Cladophialophora bantiana CBS 173.52]KIW92089.1 hypothetical protein Z519_07073 [Cladophialophora bantiana CBS 173.52]